MAWDTVTDINDGQDFGGDAWQTAIDAITQIQDALGPDEVRVPQLIGTASGAGASLSIAGIPQTFRHLMLCGSVNHDNASGGGANRELGIRFNGNGGGVYDSMVTYTDGTGTSALTGGPYNDVTVGRCGSLGTQQSSVELMMVNYRVLSSLRLWHGDGASAASSPGAGWRRWQSMFLYQVGEAITSLELNIIAGGGDAFAAASSVALYGLP